MTIKEYELILKDKSKKMLKFRLDSALEQIEFLESIYMTGGENHYYSREFSDASLTERQELCQLTSAIYSLLRKEN